MQQGAVRPPAVIDYATPVRALPRRWWLFAVFAVGLFALEDVLPPRKTPPGWPLSYDYVLMLLLPIGAFTMARASSLPGWLIGIYGLGGACTFLLGQLTDRRLHFRLAEPRGIFWFVVNWSVFIAASWSFCRSTVLLRRRPAV